MTERAPLTCHCGTEFTPARKWQRFCSTACKRRAYTGGAGEIVSQRQLKNGKWALITHFNTRLDANVGEFVRLMRSERIS